MANWIPGQGFHLVQSSGPINETENKKRMDLLEVRLQEAEIRFGIRKEQSEWRAKNIITYFVFVKIVVILLLFQNNWKLVYYLKQELSSVHAANMKMSIWKG